MMPGLLPFTPSGPPLRGVQIFSCKFVEPDWIFIATLRSLKKEGPCLGSFFFKMAGGCQSNQKRNNPKTNMLIFYSIEYAPNYAPRLLPCFNVNPRFSLTSRLHIGPPAAAFSEPYPWVSDCLEGWNQLNSRLAQLIRNLCPCLIPGTIRQAKGKAVERAGVGQIGKGIKAAKQDEVQAHP